MNRLVVCVHTLNRSGARTLPCGRPFLSDRHLFLFHPSSTTKQRFYRRGDRGQLASRRPVGINFFTIFQVKTETLSEENVLELKVRTSFYIFQIYKLFIVIC